MAFVLGNDIDEDDRTPEWFERFNKKWSDYFAYLKNIKSQIPKSAYEFATANWHYNPSDSKCPHDAWLEDIIFEKCRRRPKTISDN